MEWSFHEAASMYANLELNFSPIEYSQVARLTKQYESKFLNFIVVSVFCDFALVWP